MGHVKFLKPLFAEAGIVRPPNHHWLAIRWSARNRKNARTSPCLPFRSLPGGSGGGGWRFRFSATHLSYMASFSTLNTPIKQGRIRRGRIGKRMKNGEVCCLLEMSIGWRARTRSFGISCGVSRQRTRAGEWGAPHFFIFRQSPLQWKKKTKNLLFCFFRLSHFFVLSCFYNWYLSKTRSK